MLKKFLLLLTFIFFIHPAAAMAQMTDLSADSLIQQVGADSMAPVKTSLWPALIRSAVVPGWGQIEQEHPGRAVVFYGLGIYMMYNLAWNYRQYDKTNEHKYWKNVTHYAIIYGQIYALNLMDVAHNHFFHEDQPWPGQLFSDLPVKSPWGAVARSAMLPGWGQLYNEKYLKALVSFGVCFDFARKVYVFNQRYQRSGRKFYLERRVVNSWYLGLFYALNMVDAYVDAYLFEFDDMMKLTVAYSAPERTPLIGVHFEF